MTGVQTCALPIPLVKGSVCTYSVEKTNDSVRLFMQDQLIIEYVDPVPLIGPQHEYFGIEGDSNNQSIDKIGRASCRERV